MGVLRLWHALCLFAASGVLPALAMLPVHAGPFQIRGAGQEVPNGRMFVSGFFPDPFFAGTASLAQTGRSRLPSGEARDCRGNGRRGGGRILRSFPGHGRFGGYRRNQLDRGDGMPGGREGRFFLRGERHPGAPADEDGDRHPGRGALTGVFSALPELRVAVYRIGPRGLLKTRRSDR